MVMTGAARRKMRKKGLETCRNMSPSFGSYIIYYHTTLLRLCFQNFNKIAQMAELISKKCKKVVPVTHKMAIKERK